MLVINSYTEYLWLDLTGVNGYCLHNVYGYFSLRVIGYRYFLHNIYGYFSLRVNGYFFTERLGLDLTAC